MAGSPAFQGRSRQLDLWVDMAQHAYAPDTIRAWKNDWHAFLKFTREAQLPSLPSTPETIRRFLVARAESGLAMSTLRRLCSSIAGVHRAADLPNPVESEAVRLALRAHARQIGTRFGTLQLRDAFVLVGLFHPNARSQLEDHDAKTESRLGAGDRARSRLEITRSVFTV